MIRKIIKIDTEKCNGCGLCATACHEGAIAIVNQKAKLIHDHYCDGLGDCLPTCPTGAITFEEREAAAYDKNAVEQHLKQSNSYESELKQWPVQIKLVPVNAPYFNNSHLLIAADCTAFAYGNFHYEFIRNHITLIGCPKLDTVDYSEKLTQIIQSNTIQTITVVRMEVPCCSGIKNAVFTALKNSGKQIPVQTVIISTDGKIINRE